MEYFHYLDYIHIFDWIISNIQMFHLKGYHYETYKNSDLRR